jgi:hypothetical protein
MTGFAEAFTLGVDRMYARMGVPARYTFKDGYWVDCTVIPNRSMEAYGETVQVRGSSLIISVRVSEVDPRPQRGERVELLDTHESFTVDETVASDEHEHTFSCA